jgi:hypothetical protein
MAASTRSLKGSDGASSLNGHDGLKVSGQLSIYFGLRSSLGVRDLKGHEQVVQAELSTGTDWQFFNGCRRSRFVFELVAVVYRAQVKSDKW